MITLSYILAVYPLPTGELGVVAGVNGPLRNHRVEVAVIRELRFDPVPPKQELFRHLRVDEASLLSCGI